MADLAKKAFWKKSGRCRRYNAGNHHLAWRTNLTLKLP
jgi:hypothetical protein